MILLVRGCLDWIWKWRCMFLFESTVDYTGLQHMTSCPIHPFIPSGPQTQKKDNPVFWVDHFSFRTVKQANKVAVGCHDTWSNPTSHKLSTFSSNWQLAPQASSIWSIVGNWVDIHCFWVLSRPPCLDVLPIHCSYNAWQLLPYYLSRRRAVMTAVSFVLTSFIEWTCIITSLWELLCVQSGH